MIIVGTGITGVGRTHYLKEVAEYSRLNNVPADVIDIGPRMFEKASSLRIKIPGDKILDLDTTTLRFLRATVFEEITSNVEGYRGFDKDLMISLHMSFRWNKVLMPAFDYYYLNKLKPDLYCSLVDSVGNILRRIEDTPDLAHWKDKLSIKEILIWQDEEMFTTEIVADILGSPHYMIPSSASPSIMYNVINMVEKPLAGGERPRMLKAYISYPMTMTKGNVEFEETRRELVSKLKKKGIIIFDPAMIEDMIILEKVKDTEENNVYIEEYGVYVSRKEVLDAEKYIIDHTVHRDYKFIDQSDMIIVYYPIKELSAGVLSEMIYAHTHMKNVYALFTQKNISPFFLNYSTKIFRDIDELVEFVAGLVGQ